MPLLSSKSQLASFDDWELDIVCMIAHGYARMKDDKGNYIEWWPKPWLNHYILEIYSEIFGPNPFQPVYCHSTAGTAMVNALGTHLEVERDVLWSNRQYAEELVWYADQNSLMPTVEE